MRFAAPLALALAALATLQEPEQPPAPQPPAIGSAAPTFRLNDHEGAARTVGGVSDDWTAVAFYPKAMTPG